MSWPTPAEINEAIQNPQLSFKDPELSEGKAEIDAHGIPLARSGANADVYCFFCGSKRVAVKCFTRPIAHLEQRYQEVHSALSNLQLPFTVDFSYRSEGLWLRDQWYPLVRMQWVDGLRLNEFVQSTIDRPELLQNLIKILAKMNDWLDVNQIAHGDLQHGNILLIPNTDGRKLAVRLVDYDGMWVPALANEPAQEFGHADYQHPERLARGYCGPAVDRFSLLAIATGLRALIVQGQELWQRYDNSANIVFQQKDFVDPHRSPLFEELGRSSDETLRRLCGTLADACTHRIEDVPHLSDVLKSLPGAAAKPTSKSGVSAPVPDPKLGSPWQGIEDASDADIEIRPRKSADPALPAPKPAPKLPRWRRLAVSAGALLLGVTVLWAAGAFKKKAPAHAQAEIPGSLPASSEKSNAPTVTSSTAKPKTAWQKARTNHTNAIKDANTRLLQHFDRVIKNLTNQNDVLLADAIRDEKKRFAEKGLIPWSEPMWPHCQNYLQVIQLAEAELETSWNTELDRATRANDEVTLRALPSELSDAGTIRIIGGWKHQPPGKGAAGVIQLYSNGKIGGKNAANSWTLQSDNTLVLIWPNPQAPGGKWIDKCKVSRDGKSYAGSNQRGAKIAGWIVVD